MTPKLHEIKKKKAIKVRNQRKIQKPRQNKVRFNVTDDQCAPGCVILPMNKTFKLKADYQNMFHVITVSKKLLISQVNI